MLPTRPLPGIRFRAEQPALATLPRMDIAAFVGFAARGPLHLPVPVEDMPRFLDIFGPAPQLAWDGDTNRWQLAHLAGAVRDFFAQGGRRCWVVRVAGGAEQNLFPLAGLLQQDGTQLSAAIGRARSAGSWADELEVQSAPLIDAMQVEPLTLVAGSHFDGRLRTLRNDLLQAGDVLRLSFGDEQIAFCHVEDAQEIGQSAVPGGRAFQISGPLFWFRPLGAAGNLSGTMSAGLPVGLAARSARATLNTAVLQLASDDDLELPPGSWLRFESAAGLAWLLVAEPIAGGIRLAGGWWQGTAGSQQRELLRAQRISLVLRVRAGSNLQQTIGDLALGAPHPRFCGALPDDPALFAPADRSGEQPELWREVSDPRFPLAGPANSSLLLPLGLELMAGVWMHSRHSGAPALQRDGLLPPAAPATLNGRDWASFLDTIFLDPVLRWSGQHGLLADAFERQVVQGISLAGLHGVLPLDEVSLLAIPDAAQRGWRLELRPSPPLPEEPPEQEAPPDPCAKEGIFQPKVERAATDSTEEGEGEDEGEDEQDDDAAPPESIAAWVLLPVAEYEQSGLLAIQRAATELAAARANLVTILHLPQHYRSDPGLDYQRALKSTLQQAGPATAGYAALYHPWLIEREQSGALQTINPDGAACGVIAAQSLARGPWVPPANQPLRAALALTPRLFGDDHERFYRAGVNLIDNSARGFVLWGAATLSDDPDLGLLNVRRLLILLRRLSLRDGQAYVFAPHSPAFRRRVARSLERTLGGLFQRGAFAGSEPAQAYRVVIDETINTAASIAQGRLIIELRIAPARPLSFITVRLIQTESGVRAVEELA